ncbi:MAG: CBS domain-containing protein [Saprospiraceae bacterium]|nr:MAG: histidine kinase [Bacteroidetes bacterium OLB9]MCO6464864.1 CBS domain-containing protein [Saprospiraceae bacterium]
MMNLEVRDIMTKENLIVAHPEQTIKEIANIMIEKHMQQLPVTDAEDKLVGMVTTYDLWKASRDGIDEGTLIGDIMTTQIVRITPKDKVGTAAELFALRRLKTLPVVNLDNKLKGVVTAFDVIRVVFKEEYPQPILFTEAFTR